MSALHNGSLRSMKAHYTVDAQDLRVIRPLVYVREAEAAAFAEGAGLPVVPETCPACFDAPKERYRIKCLLATQEALFPTLQSVLKTILPPPSTSRTFIFAARCMAAAPARPLCRRRCRRRRRRREAARRAGDARPIRLAGRVDGRARPRSAAPRRRRPRLLDAAPAAGGGGGGGKGASEPIEWFGGTPDVETGVFVPAGGYKDHAHAVRRKAPPAGGGAGGWCRCAAPRSGRRRCARRRRCSLASRRRGAATARGSRARRRRRRRPPLAARVRGRRRGGRGWRSAAR